MFVANWVNKKKTHDVHEMKIEYSQIRCAYSSTDENTISTKIEHMMSLPCIPFLVFWSSFPQTTQHFFDIHIMCHHIPIVLHLPFCAGARTVVVHVVPVCSVGRAWIRHVINPHAIYSDEIRPVMGRSHRLCILCVHSMSMPTILVVAVYVCGITKIYIKKKISAYWWNYH